MSSDFQNTVRHRILPDPLAVPPPSERIHPRIAHLFGRAKSLPGLFVERRPVTGRVHVTFKESTSVTVARTCQLASELLHRPSAGAPSGEKSLAPSPRTANVSNLSSRAADERRRGRPAAANKRRQINYDSSLVDERRAPR